MLLIGFGGTLSDRLLLIVMSFAVPSLRALLEPGERSAAADGLGNRGMFAVEALF